MLTLPEKIIFLIAVVASLYFTFINFRKAYLAIRRGQGDFSLRNALGRLMEAAAKWAGMLPTWRYRKTSNIFHAMVAWGFIFYFLVNSGDVLQGYINGFVFLGQGVIGDIYRFLADIFSVAVLAGVLYFVLRRFVFRSPALSFHDNIRLMPRVAAGGMRRDSLIVAGFIFLHVGFRFLGETFALACEPGHAGVELFATAASTLWDGWSPLALNVAQHGAWWIALGLILAFIPYFPYTKHFHLIMSGVNFPSSPRDLAWARWSRSISTTSRSSSSASRDRGSALEAHPGRVRLYHVQPLPGRLPGLCDRQGAFALGAGDQQALLPERTPDSFAAGKETPEKLIDYATSESAVWACTACGACVEICPVGNEPMFDLLYMRRNQVLMESDFPRQLQTAFKGMERNGNPWNLSRSDRMNWAKGLEIPTIEDNPELDLLWWVGCAPSYDSRAQETARAFARVLKAAGVNYAVLGELESCTGDSARRAGNEALLLPAGAGQRRGAQRGEPEADRGDLPPLLPHVGQGIRPVRRQLRCSPSQPAHRRADRAGKLP